MTSVMCGHVEIFGVQPPLFAGGGGGRFIESWLKSVEKHHLGLCERDIILFCSSSSSFLPFVVFGVSTSGGV